mgnify:CR=1 FL=1|tara:strand:+ start:717321 stop:718175 length:855 start_codon:yes stop_codon:yes gene_type:complete
MDNKIKFCKGKYGKKAIIQCRWNSTLLKELIKNDISEIELNDGLGWAAQNLDFLVELKDLKAIKIIDLTIDDISAIHSLQELEEMEVITYCKTPIDFNKFPNLKHCSFEWRPKSFSLFDNRNLKTLFINNFKSKESKYFSNLKDLEELSIYNSSIEKLLPIFSLLKLRKLKLANLNNVDNLSGINQLSNLVELEIERCVQIKNLDKIFNLNKLTRLLLIDLKEINSFHGLESLSRLKTLLFYGSTNILDGDLSPILKLNHLENLSFQNRRHYTHKREEFPSYSK